MPSQQRNFGYLQHGPAAGGAICCTHWRDIDADWLTDRTFGDRTVRPERNRGGPRPDHTRSSAILILGAAQRREFRVFFD